VADTAQPDRETRHSRFLLLYALAWAGATIAYTPFLTLLLPVRVELLAGDANVHWLAATTFAGAIASSLSNILFGWLSDVTGQRRVWVAAGLLLSGVCLLAVPGVSALGPLVALIVAWQCALNMMIGPLSAWAGDCVPDRWKGTLGGLMAFAPASGALSGALVTVPGLAQAEDRYAIVVALTAACVLPLLLLGGRGGADKETSAEARQDTRSRGEDARPRRPVGRWRWLGTTISRMWLARLLVQISEAALFAYLYVWFRSVDPGFDDSRVARLFSLVLFLGAPIALATGCWADRQTRPIAPLRAASLVSAVGLVTMALAGSSLTAMAGYLVFGLSSTVFLSLHSAQTLRILPDSTRRGRDLGLFNLTNTVPSLIMPTLTLALVPRLGFPALFLVLAALSIAAAVLLRSTPGAAPRT